MPLEPLEKWQIRSLVQRLEDVVEVADRLMSVNQKN
jgi:hypothetical protein